MRLETPPIPARSGGRPTASALARRDPATRVPTAAPPPVQRGTSPVSPCGAEGCLEVARLGAAFCPLHE
jgi:hypothetical protein